MTSGKRAEIGESLPPPFKLWELQEALHAKAKGNPSYRFYALYDKLCRQDVLAEAWRRCLANGGAAGVDGVSFEKIEAYGVSGWLGELAQELRGKNYCPAAVRRVYIPKPDGKQRPLDIPVIRDRVVQMAAVLILEPLFEADLQDEQYAYRAKRDAHDAVREVHRWLNRGFREVVDADLSGDFDTIPHPQLLKSLARAHSRRQPNEAAQAVVADAGRGKRWKGSQTTEQSGPAPQTGHSARGADLPAIEQPLHEALRAGVESLGYGERLQARIVNYADDFVILCRKSGEHAYATMSALMGKLGLRVNPEKTRLCKVPEESFDFLGYRFGRCYSTQNGREYIGAQPSTKKIAGIIKRISQKTQRGTLCCEAAEKVEELNALLRGWGNYFCLGPVSKAYRAVDAHCCYRLRQWLRRKHKLRGASVGRYRDEYLYGTLGLVRWAATTPNFPWAKA